MYSLEFYDPDGASVREGEFENAEDAIDRWNNIGSRWIFYPMGVIFTSGGKVKVAAYGCEHLEGIYRKSFEQELKESVSWEF